MEESKNPITYLEKPVYDMTDEEMTELFDTKWYPRANNALYNQCMIWDYNYLAYKSILTYSEISKTRRLS